MELVKDIYFNTDKLVENSKVKVSYTGKFYQGNNDTVFLHYGYGKDWNNVNDIEMKKTDLGYQAEIKLACEDTLNFCFKNQSNEWDNNFGKNYIFNIEKENQPIAESKDNVNVYWGANFSGNEQKDANSFIPNQADAIIGNNALKFTNELGTIDIAPTVEIKEDLSTPAKIITPFNANKETAIALAPTGFDYWTKRIKDAVCDIFASVPKLISGNYKRFISKNK